jgi:hypothetical protein
MNGNPITSDIGHFRKKMIVANKRLRYLDRPIFDMERASCEAWSTGGRDAELKTKMEWQERKKQDEARGMESFRKWQMEFKAKAMSEKEAIKVFGPTPAQQAKQEENLLRKKDREKKAAQAAEREREIYRIRDLDETQSSTPLYGDTYRPYDNESSKKFCENEEKESSKQPFKSSKIEEADYYKDGNDSPASFKSEDFCYSDSSHDTVQEKMDEMRNFHDASDQDFSASKGEDVEYDRENCPKLCHESAFVDVTQDVLQDHLDGMKSPTFARDVSSSQCKAVKREQEGDESPTSFDVSSHFNGSKGNLTQDFAPDKFLDRPNMFHTLGDFPHGFDASKLEDTKHERNTKDSPSTECFTPSKTTAIDDSNPSNILLHEDEDEMKNNAPPHHISLEDGVPSVPTTIVWTPSMDETLKELTAQHSLNFEHVSNDMSRDYGSLEFTAEVCRSRWCILVDSDCTTATTSRPLESFHSTMGNQQRASFDELMFVSPIIAIQPSSFPSMDDDSSDED